MKNVFTIFLIFIISLNYAQYSITNILEDDAKVIFTGIDFRHAKFIGKEHFNNTYKIQNTYLSQFNSIYYKEYQKYSFQKELRLSDQNYAVSVDDMIRLNKSIKVAEIVTNKMDYTIEEESLAEIIKDYTSESKKGIGVAYIVESFNKMKERCIFYVVFYDISTKTVLFSEKVSIQPFGGGFRNYWIKPFHFVQKEYFPKWYKKWKKLY